MWRRRKARSGPNIDGMVHEELRRLGYAGSRRVPRQVFHAALGQVCHRLLVQGGGETPERMSRGPAPELLPGRCTG